MSHHATHAALPLIEALFDGTIDDAGFARLEAMLRDDVEARAIYRSMANLHATLPSIVNQTPRLSIRLTDGLGESVLEPHEMPHDQLMSLIAQVESAGEDLDPMALAAARFPEQQPGPITKQQWAQAGRYVLSQAKQYRQQMIMGAAAAVMLLAAVLFLTLGGSKPSAPLAGEVLQGERPEATNQRSPLMPVATLTVAHDAQWVSDFDFGTPVPGDVLVADRTLTLTHGFAEITTKRGAVVILEAPCEIELIDSPNALRLHAGKLVGVCETPTSKGFLVRTPHMDITDIGTRFGVVCDDQGSYLRVFEGEVYATSVQSASVDEQTVVLAGESVVVGSDAMRVERVDEVASRFVTTMQAVAAVPELSGAIRYEPSMPGDLRVGVYESSEIRLFKERANIELSDPIAVNLTAPGVYQDDALQEPIALSTVTVDSYLIHLDTLPLEGSGKTHRATVRFDHPIVGMITSTQAMVDSHRVLGLADVRYGSASDEASSRFTGLDRSTKTSQEIVEISDDRRTLTLQLSTGDGIDQVRVLIASQPSP